MYHLYHYHQSISIFSIYIKYILSLNQRKLQYLYTFNRTHSTFNPFPHLLQILLNHILSHINNLTLIPINNIPTLEHLLSFILIHPTLFYSNIII